MLKCAVFIALWFSNVALFGQQQPAPTTPRPQAAVAAPQPLPPQHWYLRPEWVGVIITGVYVVIAGGTLFAILKQTGRMSRQADLMNRQTRIAVESLRVTREAADAAKESADVAAAQTKAMTDRERARLYVDTPPSPIMGSVLSHTNIFGLQLTVRNVAPTAAINVKAVYSAIALEMQTEPRGARQFNLGVHEVIEGNGKVEAPVLIYASFAELQAQTKPQSFWCHVWGRIEYNDVLTEEIHCTQFRFCAQAKQVRGDGSVVVDGPWMKWGNLEDNKAT